MIRNPSAMRRLAAGDSYTFLMKELEKVDDVILEPLTGTDWPRDMPVITGGGLLESIASIDVTYASSGGDDDNLFFEAANDIPVIQADMSKSIARTFNFAEYMAFSVLEKEKLHGSIFVMAGDNVLDFSLQPFLAYAEGCGTSCVLCHEEHRLEALRKTAVITVDEGGLITGYEEKPAEPKGHLAVPPFYFYREEDWRRIPEALSAGCSADAPGSFAAWLAGKTAMHAWQMPGHRYDIGDLPSYEDVKRRFA